MSAKVVRSCLLFCGVILGGAIAPSASAGVCPCSGDVDPCVPDGSINVSDIFVSFDCALHQQAPCDRPLETCDVNCDGVVDFQDPAIVWSQFELRPDACNTTIMGACCNDRDDMAGCVVTSDSLCGNVIGGTYLGDGTTCNPSPCDCNNNGVGDGEDIAGASEDCNTNGIPDECEPGACCFVATGGTCVGGPADGRSCTSPDECQGGACVTTDIQSCASTRQATCEAPPINGIFRGVCQECPSQNVAIVPEGDGSIFIHVVGPPVECPTGGEIAAQAGTCTGPPYTDAWVSASGNMCHNFGVPGSPAIPADFFGPGSDPFTGAVCLEGAPLGPTVFGDFGDADTLIYRSADPFDRCDLPSATEQTVDIEIVALSLRSISPITVTFNGGQNPESWDVAVDLSPGGLQGGTPASSLSATKTHCNGGTYTSILYVQPRFTFTDVSAPATQQVLDTGTEGLDAIPLVQSTGAPWVADLEAGVGAMGDPCTTFHSGYTEQSPTTDCDCNANSLRDKCDIEQGAAADCNSNTRPDSCDIAVDPALDVDTNGVIDTCQAAIPTVSEWGLAIMLLSLLAAGCVVMRRHQRRVA